MDTGPPAIVHVILHIFKWCISHSSSCVFESVTLFSDSQSVPTIFSAPLPYKISKCLTDPQPLLNSLSNSKVVLLQWISGHSSLPSNNLANFLAKLVPLTTPPPYHSPSHLLFPIHAYPSTPIGDVISNLVFNIKALHYFLRSLPTIILLVPSFH